MAKERVRADQLLVTRGLAASRQKARALIMAGEVHLQDRRVDKAGEWLDPDADVRVRARIPYVSRGGLKLEAGLEHFRVDPAGRLCLDLGSSTGGFTDCLLQRGARRVIAVDVGVNQMDHRLRADDRVEAREGVNARHLTAEDFPERPSLIVADLSFIGLDKVLPHICALLSNPELLVLVKPQFEVGPGVVEKGIVRDAAARDAAVARVARAVEALGYTVDAPLPCPVKGARGNQEYLLHARSTGRMKGAGAPAEGGAP